MFSISLWRARMRRWARAIYRELRHPRKLRGSQWRRHVGKIALDRRLWVPERHRVSLGVACGLFIGMIVMPGQMPASFALAWLLRCNAPSAVIASWAGNPITFGPILAAEYWISDYMFPGPAMEDSWMFKAIKTYAAAPVLGILVALCGYFLVSSVWYFVEDRALARKAKTKIPTPRP
jgi:uncharacterized protein (DUF2062 family)